jgi:hypothetical protein
MARDTRFGAVPAAQLILSRSCWLNSDSITPIAA